MFKREHTTPEFIQMNPLRNIPLLNDNGAYIADSHVICAYLVDKYAINDALYPKDPLKRAMVDSRMYFDAGFLFARLRFLYEPIAFGDVPEQAADKVEYASRPLGITEALLKDEPYICGDHLTIADFCCIATISSLIEPVAPEKNKYPRISAWMERLAELPYYEDANQFGADEFKQMVRNRLAENRAKA